MKWCEFVGSAGTPEVEEELGNSCDSRNCSQDLGIVVLASSPRLAMIAGHERLLTRKWNSAQGMLKAALVEVIERFAEAMPLRPLWNVFWQLRLSEASFCLYPQNLFWICWSENFKPQFQEDIAPIRENNMKPVYVN